MTRPGRSPAGPYRPLSAVRGEKRSTCSKTLCESVAAVGYGRGVVGEQPLIYAEGLVKRFGDFVAVDGIDFQVRAGEAFGFLGPNGAGKSSTMRMIGCVSPPSGGVLRILGMDPVRQGAQIRARLGVCPQLDTLDQDLTVRENLITYARYFGIPRREARRRADALLEFVQLADRAGGKVARLGRRDERHIAATLWGSAPPRFARNPRFVAAIDRRSPGTCTALDPHRTARAATTSRRTATVFKGPGPIALGRGRNATRGAVSRRGRTASAGRWKVRQSRSGVCRGRGVRVPV